MKYYGAFLRQIKKPIEPLYKKAKDITEEHFVQIQRVARECKICCGNIVCLNA